jgi:hypothetical protein
MIRSSNRISNASMAFTSLLRAAPRPEWELRQFWRWVDLNLGTEESGRRPTGLQQQMVDLHGSDAVSG